MKTFRKTLTAIACASFVLLSTNSVVAADQASVVSDHVPASANVVAKQDTSSLSPLNNDELIALHLARDINQSEISESDTTQSSSTPRRPIQRPGFPKISPSPQGDMYCIIIGCKDKQTSSADAIAVESAPSVAADKASPPRVTLTSLLSPLPRDTRFIGPIKEPAKTVKPDNKLSLAGLPKSKLLAILSSQRPGFPRYAPEIQEGINCPAETCGNTELIASKKTIRTPKELTMSPLDQ